MPQFRKRPVVIEAVQWFEREHLERQNFKPGHGISGQPDSITGVYYKFHSDPGDPPTPMIGTLEGEHIVSDGDWIITGIKGERYPCKPDIFAATYDEI